MRLNFLTTLTIIAVTVTAIFVVAAKAFCALTVMVG